MKKQVTLIILLILFSMTSFGQDYIKTYYYIANTHKDQTEEEIGKVPLETLNTTIIINEGERNIYFSNHQEDIVVFKIIEKEVKDIDTDFEKINGEIVQGKHKVIRFKTVGKDGRKIIIFVSQYYVILSDEVTGKLTTLLEK